MPKLGNAREGRCDSRGNCSSSGLALVPSSLDTFHLLKGIRRGEKRGEAELGEEVCCPQPTAPRTAQDVCQALVLTGPCYATHQESQGLSAFTECPLPDAATHSILQPLVPGGKTETSAVTLYSQVGTNFGG